MDFSMPSPRAMEKMTMLGRGSKEAGGGTIYENEGEGDGDVDPG